MDELYCICRQQADDRFMIACDKCEEWFHGECINLDESDARYIKEFFCDTCKDSDPTLKTRFRKKKDKEQARKIKKERKREKGKSYKAEKKKEKRKVRIFSSDDDDPVPQKINVKTPMDPSSIFSDDEGDDNYEKFLSTQKETDNKTFPKAKKIDVDFEPDSFDQDPDDSFEIEREPKVPKKKSREKAPLPQCLGPRCIHQARKRSKYCSDACGRLLASKRIDRFLVPRLDQIGGDPGVATIEQAYKLEKLERKYKSEVQRRNKLEKDFNFLEDVISSSKKKPILRDSETVEEPDDHMFCPVCGHLSSSRTIFKHIDKCYRKFESGTTYGWAEATCVEGSKRLFCDFYNGSNGTYCKRLKVMCPEHTKEQKMDESEVCGCPLDKNSYDFYKETIDKIPFCQLSKKTCKKHYLWEKMYRAEVDIKRIRALMRMVDVLNEQNKIKAMIEARQSVAMFMFNETIRHSNITDMRPECRKEETAPAIEAYLNKKGLNSSFNSSQNSIKAEHADEIIKVT